MAPRKRARVQVRSGNEISADHSNSETPTLQLPEGSWNKMHHDVLVSIMKLTSYVDRGGSLYFVCKSWRTAVLESIFPVGDVLDLSFLDDESLRCDDCSYILPGVLYWGTMNMHTVYLILLYQVLKDRQYTKLVLPFIQLFPYEKLQRNYQPEVVSVEIAIR